MSNDKLSPVQWLLVMVGGLIIYPYFFVVDRLKKRHICYPDGYRMKDGLEKDCPICRSEKELL